MAATGKFVAAVGETLVDVGRITSDKESVTLKPAKKSGLERDIKADLRRIYKPSQKNRLWHKYSFLQGCIVDLQGLIAVGKSTIGQSLYDFLTWLGFEVVLCLEEIPEPLLGLYGKEMKKYAFPFQTIVASHRLTVHSDGIKNGKGKIWITDRGLLGDYVFALMQYRKGFFTEEEFQAYMEMVGKALPEPDYVLHVDTSAEIAFARMQERGVKEERESYKLEYFQEVDATYKEVMAVYGKVIAVPWSSKEEVTNGRLSMKKCEEILDVLWERHQQQI